jgi:uncharacterized membrane protein YhaH (DUF805 family)
MSVEKLINAFRGRASRLQFWVVVAVVVPALMVLLLCFWMYALSIPGAYENGDPTPLPTDPLGIAGAVAWLVALAVLIVGFLAAAIRRLHDRDKAWWWVLVFVAAPDLLDFYAFSQTVTRGGENVGGLAQLCELAGYALSLWGLVELGFLRGTAGENRFGPDPLAEYSRIDRAKPAP